MQNQQPKRAVQLIAFDQNKNPFITEPALQLLKTFQVSNLHIISVAGKYRTGKSYILNRVLLNRSDGFNVGHTINACTKGLWMWPQLIKLGDKQCLIIDTEGLGSLQEGESTDLKIFLLALLFSSYLIYNSVGKIDQQALQNLNLVVQLANILQRQDRYDTQQLINTFPSFMWLLRDFSLKLQNEKGEAITTSEYLEQALKHQPKNTQAADRKNQIRMQIKTFFENRECFALVRPTEEQKDLHNLNSLPQSKLRPEFVKLIHSLKAHICQAVRPKKVKGRTLSIQGFIEMCKYYTKALVDGKLPAISSHWDNLCLGQTQRIFQKYQHQHLKALQQISEIGQQLLSVHKSIVKSGVEAIDKSFLGKLQKQLFRERLEKKMDNQYQQVKLKLNNKKNTELRSQLQQIELLGDDSDHMVDDSDHMVERYEDLMQKLMQLTEQNISNDKIYCELFLYLGQQARSLLQCAQSKKKEMERVMNQKLQFMQSNINILKQNSSKMQDKYQQQVQQLKNQNSQLKSMNSEERKSKQENYIKDILTKNEELRQLKAQILEFTYKTNSKLERITQLEVGLKQSEAQLALLREQLHSNWIQVAKKDQLLREEAIRVRKLLRQKQIIKNRYEEYLEQNLQLRTQIDQLSIKNTEIQLKNTEIQLKKTYSGDSDLLKQLQQLRNKLRKAEDQSRLLQKLINDQKNTYETMLLAPQNKNNVAVKRHLELVAAQKQSLQQKLETLNRAISSCRSFKCMNCGQSYCGKLLTQHYKLCESARREEMQMEFDVSYSYDQKGSIVFEIDIRLQENEWKTTKSFQDTRTFVRRYSHNEETSLLFPLIEQTNHSHNDQQQIQNRSQSPLTQQNLDEQRRALVDELLHTLKPNLFADHLLAQFLQLPQNYRNYGLQADSKLVCVGQPLRQKNIFVEDTRSKWETCTY